MHHRSALYCNRRAACAAAALLAFSPLAPAQDAPEPVALDADFKPAEQAAALVDLRDATALKGVKRVAVPQFTVEFVTADNVSAETSGIGMAGRSKATAHYKLVGVAEADFQTLADGFHATFLKQQLTLRVHFVQLSGNTKGFWGKMNTTAQASGKAAVAVQSATLSVMTGPTVSTATPKQPLVLDPAAFSEMRVQAKSAGDVAGAVAVGLLRLAIGSKDSQSSEAFEAVADNGRYREVVAAGLASVGELFSARVKAER